MRRCANFLPLVTPEVEIVLFPVDPVCCRNGCLGILKPASFLNIHITHCYYQLLSTETIMPKPTPAIVLRLCIKIEYDTKHATF